MNQALGRTVERMKALRDSMVDFKPNGSPATKEALNAELVRYKAAHDQHVGLLGNLIDDAEEEIEEELPVPPEHGGEA